MGEKEFQLDNWCLNDGRFLLRPLTNDLTAPSAVSGEDEIILKDHNLQDKAVQSAMFFFS